MEMTQKGIPYQTALNQLYEPLDIPVHKEDLKNSLS